MEKCDMYEIMNGKKIYSRFSGEPVTFVPEITDEMATSKEGVFCDGVNLIDNFEDVEDDISNMYCIMKDGSCYNMQDFYAEFGAYKKDSSFPENCIKLIADKDKE